MRRSRTEAPSLHRRYPASTVLRASPPPSPARPDPRGLSVGACHATGRASRVASIPLFHACCRQYPGGNGRCSRRSLPDRWQPSPWGRRVGFRITGFGACSAFTRVTARMVAEPPTAALVVGVLRAISLPPSSAPTATGWSDSCRAGFAPAEKRRLSRRTATGCWARTRSSRNTSREPNERRPHDAGRHQLVTHDNNSDVEPVPGLPLTGSGLLGLLLILLAGVRPAMASAVPLP